MKKLILLAFLFIGLNSFSQTDSTKIKRKEAIRLDSIGQVLHKSEKYIEAIDIFDKALKNDSTYGNAIYHRALSIANSGARGCNSVNICNEFKKAMKYGARVPEEELFFYGCDIKKKK